VQIYAEYNIPADVMYTLAIEITIINTWTASLHSQFYKSILSSVE